MKIVNFKFVFTLATLFGYLFAARHGLGPTNSTSEAAPAKNATVASPTTTSVNPSANATPQPAHNANSSANGNRTGVQHHAHSSNALGLVGPANFTISEPPYKIKSCDQVIHIFVKRITDFNDYCKKQDGFFTMSIYMANLFESKDSNKLINSISMDSLKKIPTPLAGAPGCLDFRSEHERMAICLDNPDLADQLIQAYMDFLKCRLGDNLKPLSPEQTIKNILECKLVNKTIDAKSVLGGLGFNPPPVALPSIAGSSSKSSKSINIFYADLVVPGS